MFESVEAAELAQELRRFEPSRASRNELLERLSGWDRLISWAQAGQLATLAEFARRPDPLDLRRAVENGRAQPGEFVVDEVSAELNWSRPTADDRLALANDLAELPVTSGALACGEIDLPRARVIAEAVRGLPLQAGQSVEQRVMERAKNQTPGQLRATVLRAVLLIDPDAAERRRAAAVRTRAVRVWPQTDGMACLQADLPAAAAQAVYRQIDARAREMRQESEADSSSVRSRQTMDECRADALVELVLGDAAQERPRVWLQLVVPASALLEQSEEPAQLVGHGPITSAELYELIGGQATVQRIVTEPVSGVVLDVGTSRYVPPAAMQRLIRTRDGTCRFPGCRRQAKNGDLDHVIPFPAGPTAASNLMVLCRRHHRLKTFGGWSVSLATDATCEWTSPAGRSYLTTPEELPGARAGPLAQVGQIRQVRSPAVM